MMGVPPIMIEAFQSRPDVIHCFVTRSRALLVVSGTFNERFATSSLCSMNPIYQQILPRDARWQTT